MVRRFIVVREDALCTQRSNEPLTQSDEKASAVASHRLYFLKGGSGRRAGGRGGKGETKMRQQPPSLKKGLYEKNQKKNLPAFFSPAAAVHTHAP